MEGECIMRTEEETLRTTERNIKCQGDFMTRPTRLVILMEVMLRFSVYAKNAYAQMMWKGVGEDKALNPNFGWARVG